MSPPASQDPIPVSELRRRTAQGLLTATAAQVINLVLRTGSMIVMARLVTPEDFGLVGMVTAFTGLLALFRDAGLPMATVQRESLSSDLLSALFWINLTIGVVLTFLVAAATPAIVRFYGEERLIWITLFLSLNFAINGVSAQHRALLQRQMRFGFLAATDVTSVATSLAVGIALGAGGFGYWALVAAAVTQPLVASMVALWGCRWKPGPPRLAVGTGSMFRFGGMATLNAVVNYLAFNVDKVLLGRAFGAEQLGHYGRAYQLVNLPSDTINAALGSALFPALSRLQDDPARQRNYFLSAYGLFLTAVVPIVLVFGLFASDVVLVLLGDQWHDAIPLFRTLAPAVAALAFINPLANLLFANGHATRNLGISSLILLALLTAYLLGLPQGPIAVATGCSVALCLLVVPAVSLALRGTAIRGRDIAAIAGPLCLSTLCGGTAALGVSALLASSHMLVRLVAESATLFGIHLLVLLCMPEQRKRYSDLLIKLRSRS